MQSFITPSIREATGRIVSVSPALLEFQPLGGGSINQAFRISAPDISSSLASSRAPSITSRSGHWFGKVNSATRFPGMFEKEARGLALMAKGSLATPRVLGLEIVGDQQVLIMEWLEEAPRPKFFWHSLGQGLADLHRFTSDQFGLQGRFGLHEDNYMGSLHQSNTLSDLWTQFFVSERLEPQIRLARELNLIDRQNSRSFEKLYPLLPEIFPVEPACLLHGDLWSGNFLCAYPSSEETAPQEISPDRAISSASLSPDPSSSHTGVPVLIDPAVYFGHRSMDLAMTTLFGGFDAAFYEAYHAYYPLPMNYEEQWAVCNLYPLLIHLNLFGIGYLGEILQTLRRFS